MIPYSEALQGEANLTPRLDTQQQVYTGVHEDLKAAYDMMDESGSLAREYDQLYGGNITRWKRLNATIRLLQAIRLSDIDPETGRAWFVEAYNISEDAGKLYRRAIATSFSAKGLAYTDDVLEKYLSQDGVRWEGDNKHKLELIAMQRWINGYFEDGVEAWSDWRRLDYPVFHTGPYAQTLGVMHIPYRIPYSHSDRSATPAQFEEADKIQGPDSPDTRLWWDMK